MCGHLQLPLVFVAHRRELRARGSRAYDDDADAERCII
jgi:hypothetical protein